MSGRLIPVVKAADDGKYVKAGVNDDRLRSRGERHAAMRAGALPLAAQLGATGAYLKGESDHTIAREELRWRQLDRRGTRAQIAGLKAKAAKGKTMRTRGAIGTAGAFVATSAAVHHGANKWRKKQGLGPRKYWSGKPQPVELAKGSKNTRRRVRQGNRAEAARQAGTPANAGQASRDLRALEQADRLTPEHLKHPSPPKAATNHATTPARRALAGLKTPGGKAAAGAAAGAAAAGGILVHRRIEEHYVHPETERVRAKANSGSRR